MRIFNAQWCRIAKMCKNEKRCKKHRRTQKRQNLSSYRRRKSQNAGTAGTETAKQTAKIFKTLGKTIGEEYIKSKIKDTAKDILTRKNSISSRLQNPRSVHNMTLRSHIRYPVSTNIMPNVKDNTYSNLYSNTHKLYTPSPTMPQTAITPKKGTRPRHGSILYNISYDKTVKDAVKQKLYSEN